MVTPPSPVVPHDDRLEGVVERITFHNPENGWSILRVTPFNRLDPETVVVHQTRVFAGATMTFYGTWTTHPRYGRQFKANHAREKKPATLAALEKYLGSGLIKGVGPKTARRIVRHFKKDTLDIFENRMERLTEVPGIAEKKLEMIRTAWTRHKAIREVMMFLQSHGISTLFAVRIYKTYGDEAIQRVNQDPYGLARDFYGIGFFSADKVALSIGLAPDSPRRIMAAINHVISQGRSDGHCYLTCDQIIEGVSRLLEMELKDQIPGLLHRMTDQKELMVREMPCEKDGRLQPCYYVRTVFFDEQYTARRLADSAIPIDVDEGRVKDWIDRYCTSRKITLSPEQARAVRQIAAARFSVLTGGPGCGKTTTTRVIVALAEAMGLSVTLCAPTGRAAQRMGEVIGQEARTIHRLLEWQAGSFKKNENNTLPCDFLIVDECSMLDIHLCAALLKAVPPDSRILMIGDADQLPSVGAGNVLGDIIAAGSVPCFRLTTVFRQAGSSCIIRFAHQINQGEIPHIPSPFQAPGRWQDGTDCLFMDTDEATQDQLAFIRRIKQALPALVEEGDVAGAPEISAQQGREGADADALSAPDLSTSPFTFRINETVRPYETEIEIPDRYRHVNLDALAVAETPVAELKTVLKKIHPWSSLHYGYSAVDVVRSLYTTWIPRYFKELKEIQILSPMIRGTLGTSNLNQVIQAAANPPGPGIPELTTGRHLFRRGDRVIHRRNNYDLGVFNGDIGTVTAVDNIDMTLTVSFFPDHRQVHYSREDILELEPAWAITIHKSQGSEFDAVILPVLTQHYTLLFRNLLYTGLTRAKKLAVLVGTRRAMAMAIRNQDVRRRQTALKWLLSRETV